MYTDTSTGEKMLVVDAFKSKYVHGGRIGDSNQLDNYISAVCEV